MVPAAAAPLLGLLLLAGASGCGAACPCSDPALCDTIKDTRDFEVYVFYVRGKNWKFYDWAHVTTVALFAPYDPELMCFAHSKGARFVLKGDVPLKDIVDPEMRSAWIAEKVTLAKAQYMDGINLDIEQPVFPYTPEYHALTALVKETTEAFHAEIPGSQVTFDVAWSPACIDLRCYNYTAIAELCDFLFVMSYDEQSQIWTECIAGANAPFNQTIAGGKKESASYFSEAKPDGKCSTLGTVQSPSKHSRNVSKKLQEQKNSAKMIISRSSFHLKTWQVIDCQRSLIVWSRALVRHHTTGNIPATNSDYLIAFIP